MSDLNIPELDSKDFSRMIPRDQRKRLIDGNWGAGDIAALRKFLGLTQKQFSATIGISLRTLQNWEQDRRHPDGPAKALLTILAKHPRLILQDLRHVS